MGQTPIRIIIGEEAVSATLSDRPTATDLVQQLPLTLTFKDFNRVEKISNLPRPLTMDGMPKGDDPEIGDIGYYAPSGDLVLYYGDVPYWDGIARIGRIGGDLSKIAGQTGDFTVTIERAG